MFKEEESVRYPDIGQRVEGYVELVLDVFAEGGSGLVLDTFSREEARMHIERRSVGTVAFKNHLLYVPCSPRFVGHAH